MPQSLIRSILLTLGLLPSLIFLPRSLQLDETLSWWIISDSASDVISRSLHYQGQSPFYFLFLWLLKQCGASSEIALRFPSLVFLALATLSLERIVKLAHPKADTSFICLLLPLAWTAYYPDGPAARPYEMAILFTVLSIEKMMEWTRNPSSRNLLLSLICYVATVYCHILYSPLILLHLLIAYQYKINLTKASNLKSFVFPCVFSFILLTPNAYQLSLLMQKRVLYSLVPDPTLPLLLITLAPTYLLIPLLFLMGLWILKRRSAPSTEHTIPNAATSLWPLAIVWCFTPPIIIALYSWLSPGSLFMPRYFAWCLPGIITLTSLLILATPTKSRKLSLILSVGIVLLSILTTNRCSDDWRSASKHINASTQTPETSLTYIYPGLIELMDDNWIRTSISIDYVSAPLLYYPPGGQTIPLTGQLRTDLINDDASVTSRWVVLRNLPFSDGIDTLERIKNWAQKQDYQITEEIHYSGLVVLLKIDPISKP